jgi:hypothetical protein
MKIYSNQSDALRAILLMWTRGYRHAVVFEIRNDKLQPIARKFAENFGTEFPAWKRFQRKKNGLPSAWSCAMPKSGVLGISIVVLMASFESLDKLHESSVWRREKWRPADKIEIGDYRIAPNDKRDNGDSADTIKLTTRTITGLEQYWRALASQGQFDKIADEAARAVQIYTLFGGVRRQLRRLILGYKKLYEAKLKKPWPGPNPESLPSITGFVRGEQNESI